MASSAWQLLLFLSFGPVLKAVSEKKYISIKDSKYETFVHNLEEQYFLDKGETIQVWAEVTPFPWQDNRLIPGISDPTLLEFNASSEEKVVSKGTVTRNLTVFISQFDHSGAKSLSHDVEGNATFFIEVFNEKEIPEPIRVEAALSIGCPPQRVLAVARGSKDCYSFKNVRSVKPSYPVSNNHSVEKKQVENYNFSTMGCPISANYYDVFKPSLLLYEDDKFLREVAADYVMYELNGRTDYSYSATMEQVLCLQEAQTWRNMSSGTERDASISWNRQPWSANDDLVRGYCSILLNYKSCFTSDPSMRTPNLDQPYEILNKSGLSAIVWHSEGIYVFRATVVDPAYSFCNLTTMFAVHVHGIESTSQGLAPFLVLGTSILALMFMVVFLFLTHKYAIMLQDP